MKKRIFLILLMTACIYTATSQTVVLPVFAMEETGGSVFDRVVQSTLVLEIEKQGYSVADSVVGSDENVDVILSSKEYIGADYLLFSLYSVNDKEFRLVLSLYEISVGELLGEVRTQGKIDLSLDRMIEKAVTEVFSAIVTEEGAQSGKSTERSSSSSGDIGDAISSVSEDGSADDFPVPRDFGLVVQTGFTYMLPLLDMADYAESGYAADIAILYRMDSPGLGVALGFSGGIGIFDASGAVIESENRIYPIGAALMLHIAPRERISAAVKLKGGTVIWDIIRQSDTAEAVQLTVPFGALALEVTTFIIPSLGIGLEAGVIALFDNGKTLFEFTPAVHLKGRF